MIGGVIACSEALAIGLRQVRAVTGGRLHPLAAYLLHRGLPTLPLRMRAQQQTAQQVAYWLTGHPQVQQVYYPGFDGDLRGLLKTQLRGTGAMVAIKLTGGYRAASRVANSVRLFTHAVSLGGVDSPIQHPAALTHRPVAPDARPSNDVLRLSIGLEHVDDLIGDLDQALNGVATSGTTLNGAVEYAGFNS